MSEQEKMYADAREWAKEILETVPDRKIMAVVSALEDVALVPDGDDPFYSAENMARLRRSAQRIEGIGRA